VSKDNAPADPQPEPEPDEPSEPSAPSGPEGQQLSEYADPALDVPPEPAEPEGRRYPSTIGGAVYLVALAVSIAGTVLVTRGHWRAGIVWIAGALIGAAVGRLLLPQSQAGMLEVRRRSLDVVILAGFGIALLVLSASIKAR
jgi:hypothetical protein